MKTNSLSSTRPRAIPSASPWLSRAWRTTLGLACLLPAAQADTYSGTPARFKPDTGQPIFPAGNINVFKQYALDWNLKQTVGGHEHIFLLGDFGASLTAKLDMAFGLEMGLCFGGNADFDLGFQPTVTLPDRYPTEVPIPLTINQGLLDDSKFTTTFPPLGKAYADLIFNAEAGVQAQACVFGCADFGFNFSTCDIPALPSGDKLFKKSVRCDPTRTEKAYCAIELASFNRGDDNKARMLNVTAKNFSEFLAKPYKVFQFPESSDKRTVTVDPATDIFSVSGGFAPLYGGAPVKISSSGTLPPPLDKNKTYYVIYPQGSTFKLGLRPGNTAVNITSAGTGTHKIMLNEPKAPDKPEKGSYGTVSVASPTVNTDSDDSKRYNTAQVLKSTGAEDILSITLDAAKLATDLVLQPQPPLFPLSKSDSIGPLNYNYNIASLDLGPSVQLQTDFEMTWELLVTEMAFTVPGSSPPVTRDVKINGLRVNKLTQVTPAKIYHLTSCGPYALPAIELITVDYPGAQLPVQVTITYVAKPKLKTKVSTPFYGNLKYSALGAGVAVDYVGSLSIGPLLEGEHKFKFGEFTVFDGRPSPISAGPSQVGTVAFQMLASGPPSFSWTPKPPASNPGYSFDWADLVGGLTNWIETTGSTPLNTSFPGMSGNTGSDVKIDASPYPSLYSSRTVATMHVKPARRLDILSKAGDPPVLTVGGGLIENSGTINVSGPAAGTALKMNSRNSVLCGTGVLQLRGMAMTGYGGVEPSTFTNYNTITGTGSAMDLFGSPGATTLTNMGTISADGALGTCNALTLTLHFDNYPEETSWQILGAGDVVVATSNGRVYGSQPHASTLVIPVSLPADSGYRLQIYDLGNDGINSAAYGRGDYALRNSLGVVLASGGAFTTLDQKYFDANCNDKGLLITSAGTLVNENVIEGLPGADGDIYGDKLVTRVGSKIRASGYGAGQYASFHTAQHAGLVLAENGGQVFLGAFNALRAEWNAGQSTENDVGFFRSTGMDSNLQLLSTNMTGGCFEINSGGGMTAEDSNFTGSVFHIGDYDAAQVNMNSGRLTLTGAAQIFTGVCLSNYGTVTVNGSANFSDNELFSNNGTIAIPAVATLRIRENTLKTAAPGAPPETRVQPGLANATATTLIGGTWDITGTLLIDGAAFTAIGGNAARASTASESVDGSGVVIDNDESGASRVLSLGEAGKVRLHGANWSFPALTSLRENRGSLCLSDGAEFPRVPSSTPGDFTNRGLVRVEANGRLDVGGAYIQKGLHKQGPVGLESPFQGGVTEIVDGTIASSTDNFQILGGTVNATAASTFMNRIGTYIAPGTTIRVGSPMIDTNELDAFGQRVYVQEKVIVNLGSGVAINTIPAGADVTLHGAAVQFTALTNNLRSNAGTFTVSGDGIDNHASISLGFSGNAFVNTGRVNIIGAVSNLYTDDYLQNASAAVTHIGGEAKLISNNVTIDSGKMIVDIASRPLGNQYGVIKGGNVTLGNNLVIDFNGRLAQPSAGVDLGDMWEIVPRDLNATVGTPTYKFNGGAMPSDFLPAGSRLEVVQWNGRGLGIRVVPNAGFLTYDAWATSKGMPNDYRRDPYLDYDSNGRTNGQEFLFGPAGASNPANGTVREVVGTDGKTYREFVYVRAAGYHDAIYMPYASTDNVNWQRAPMGVMDVSAIAGTTLEQVTLRSTFPATGERVYYRIEADFNPDNFAFDSGRIPSRSISGAGGLENLGYLPGQILFFNVNAPNAGNYNSIWGSNTTFYRDWSDLPTAALHARVIGDVLPLETHGIVKVTFYGHQTSYVGVAGGSNSGSVVTSQPWSVAQSAAEPTRYSYRIALAASPPFVNFVSSNNNLASLIPNTGTLAPVFSPTATSYAISVPNATTAITLKAAPADGTCSMLLNGVLPLAPNVVSNALPLNAGPTTFTISVTAQSGAVKTNTVTVTRLASDYTVTTTAGAIVVTDIAGFGDTLEVTEPAAGSIQFSSPGRTFQVNGGAVRSEDSGSISRTGATSVTVNAGAGADFINVGPFTGTLPALTINGGIGDDTIYSYGDVTLAANASLNVDLQDDNAVPGDDTFLMAQEANILTSGTGSITVKVSRTAALYAGSSLETVNGGITVEAALPSPLGGDFNAVQLHLGMLKSTGTGGITLVADSMILEGPISRVAASPVVLRQKTATTGIDLGGADTSGTLGLTDAELDQITAGSLTIGDTATPSLNISVPVTRSAGTALTLVTATSGAAAVNPSASGTDLDLGTGGVLTLGGPGAGLTFPISGLTLDTQYAQLKVTGGVNLNNARLILSPSLAGAAGNAFRLVENDGTDAVVGTFSGYPQGSLVPWPGSTTLVGRISYTGGTGNDVVLTLESGTLSGYAAWASANIPAGKDSTFGGDWNVDGIMNGASYVFRTTKVITPGKGRITAPASIPTDVNVYLDRSVSMSTGAWTPVASWVNGAAPVLVSGVTIVSGEVRDTFAVRKVFYRYRVVKR